MEGFGDKQIALRHLKSVPEMLAIPQAKKKFDEIVRLRGGVEAVSAEVLAVVSGSPLRLWYKKRLLKLLGAPAATKRMETMKKATSTPKFLVKLWAILEENNTAMHWNADGVTFSVKSSKDMEKDVLPRYFRSRQFSTFQRQLSYFGFKKQSTQHDKCRWCHNLFQRGKPEDVLLIERKVNTGNEHKKRKLAECKSTSNNHLRCQYGKTPPT